MSLNGPDYSGGSLANLAAELEIRLTGSALIPGLHAELADLVPETDGHVLLLLDGLGSSQVPHQSAPLLSAARRANLDAPFPATTTVSLATLATATPPSQHGLIAYLMHLPDHGVVNTIKWITPGSGVAVPVDTRTFLPTPNLWERIKGAGLEPIVVQPGNFEGSKLTRLLYRGCRFEAYWTVDEFPQVVTDVAGPGRLVVAYFPSVDYYAHVAGQSSPEYQQALASADQIWDRLSSDLDDRVGLTATGDHGHIDVTPARKQRISSTGLTMYGDPRALFLRGDEATIVNRVQSHDGELLPLAEVRSWWGPGPDNPALSQRLPDFVFLPSEETIALPGFMDDRLVGYHGGRHPDEARVPLIVRG